MKTKPIIIVFLGLIVMQLYAFAATQNPNHKAMVKIFSQAVQKGVNEQKLPDNYIDNPTNSNTASPNNETEKKNNTETEKSLPSCNCYDQNNPNNYPSNFYYSQSNIRIKRLTPACLCDKPSSDEINQNNNASSQSSAIINTNALGTKNNDNSNSTNQQNNNSNTNNTNASTNFGISYN